MNVFELVAEAAFQMCTVATLKSAHWVPLLGALSRSNVIAILQDEVFKGMDSCLDSFLLAVSQPKPPKVLVAPTGKKWAFWQG